MAILTLTCLPHIYIQRGTILNTALFDTHCFWLSLGRVVTECGPGKLKPRPGLQRVVPIVEGKYL